MSRTPLVRVLLIEDNPGDAVLLREMLKEPESPQIHLTHADCMKNAEEHLAKEGFDAILLDMGLPDCSGLQAIRKTLEVAPRTPLVVLTGLNDESVAVQALQNGAQDYLIKGDIEAQGVRRALRYAIERKLLELALLAEKQAAQQFFNLSADLLCVVGFDGYFKRINPAWEKKLGFSAEEILAMSCFQLIHPDDRAASLAELSKLKEGAHTLGFRNRYICKDGACLWLSWNVAPVTSQQVLYCAARDETQRKLVEETQVRIRELEFYNREVEQASQLQREFLASVSHELRTPLNAINGFSELLARDPDASQKHRKFAGYIQESGKQLLLLIDDIMDISKLAAGRIQLKREEVSINSLVRDEVAGWETSAPLRPIKVEIAEHSDLRVTGDAGRLCQVLHNLLGNAIKFTPKEKDVGISVMSKEGFARVCVWDKGIGIREQDLAVIFNLFRQVGTTTRGVREGTGLGLAITKALVQEHGGSIEVESKLGEGSRFTFSIPLHGLAQREKNGKVTFRDEANRLLKSTSDSSIPHPIPQEIT